MKQFSLILNVILVAAVGVLYYLHFSAEAHQCAKQTGSMARVKDSCGTTAPIIAYVELDSLNNNLNYIKERKKVLEAEQEIYAKQYNDSIQRLQNEQNAFMKRGNAVTQQEYEIFSKGIAARANEIEKHKQLQLQGLADRSARTMEEIQRNIRAFMKEYNKDKAYTYVLATGTGLDYMFYRDSTLNITAEVIKGLNEKLKPGAKP